MKKIDVINALIWVRRLGHGRFWDVVHAAMNDAQSVELGDWVLEMGYAITPNNW